MWEGEFTKLFNRNIEIRRNIDPIITCKPWKPVVIKNADPKEESAIQKGASIYSRPWKNVKIIPKLTVIFRAVFAFSKFFFIISWWDQVIVTPDERSKIVFNKGTLIGLKERIDIGGHVCPSSMVGEMLLWKNAQKKEIKKKISDVINKIIPVFRPFMTKVVWFPWEALSRWISRHQNKAVKNIIIKDILINFIDTLLIIISLDRTKDIDLLEAKIGQGLISTKWKGLNLFIII